MPPELAKRRRGAPRGNKNALKHGYYSRQIKSPDHVDLESVDSVGLTEEITMMRAFIRRVNKLGNDASHLREAVSLLRVMCLASASLMRLLRTQHFLGQENDKNTLAFHEILDELTERIELLDPGSRKDASDVIQTS